MAVKNWWGQRALALVRMTGRTGGFRFQSKVCCRYHGSYCDSEMNFNAPLRWFCVTLPSLFSPFFLSSAEYPLPFPLDQSCCDDIRAVWSAGDTGAHGREKRCVCVCVCLVVGVSGACDLETNAEHYTQHLPTCTHALLLAVSLLIFLAEVSTIQLVSCCWHTLRSVWFSV